jgi:hypothetical protein
MLNAASQSKMADGSRTPQNAIRVAWLVWVGLLVIPFFVFLFVVWTLSGAGDGLGGVRRNDGELWFLIGSLYLVLVVPISFFWRGHVFKAYWSGHPVKPAEYLTGMISLWLALVVGGLFSLVGCLVSRSLLPDLLPALVAFMFFVTLWPSGRAMIRTVGRSEDPQIYEEPR